MISGYMCIHPAHVQANCIALSEMFNISNMKVLSVPISLYSALYIAKQFAHFLTACDGFRNIGSAFIGDCESTPSVVNWTLKDRCYNLQWWQQCPGVH